MCSMLGQMVHVVLHQRAPQQGARQVEGDCVLLNTQELCDKKKLHLVLIYSDLADIVYSVIHME